MIRDGSWIRGVGTAALMVIGLGAGTCDTVTETEESRVTVIPSTALVVGAGETVSFSATVRSGSGDVLQEAAVTWSTEDAGVATISAHGTATGVATGTTTVTAEADDATGTASLEVWVPEEVDRYDPGTTYGGRAGYVEYTPGTLPIILSAGHGGELEPFEIPDRSYGTTVSDANTIELTNAVSDALLARTGARPHVILNRLERIKLDPNREIEEAAQGNPYAELAWDEYHGYIEDARAIVTAGHGAGLYLDMHGHGHEILRLELGYLLSDNALARSDAELDAGGYAEQSSIAALAAGVDSPFSALLRGPSSLGALLADRGVRAVPSDDEPAPGSDPYFSGGFSTRLHGSRDGGTISGIQIEHHRQGLRDTQANREAYAAILAEVLEGYLARHFQLTLSVPDAMRGPAH